MTAFNIDLNTEQPDRIFVEVDHRFDVAIKRTETGLSLRVYPRTDGELWIEPFSCQGPPTIILSHQPECKLEAGGKSKRGIVHANAKCEIDHNCFWLLLGL